MYSYVYLDLDISFVVGQLYSLKNDWLRLHICAKDELQCCTKVSRHHLIYCFNNVVISIKKPEKTSGMVTGVVTQANAPIEDIYI